MVNRRWTRAPLALFAVASASACKPDVDEQVSIVTGPRVLAVRAEPAEAPPSAAVTFTALYVDGSGPIAGAQASAIDWAFCNARKPLADLDPVSAQCMQRNGDFLDEIGLGPEVAASIPQKACRQFGPDVPEPKADEPAGRPVDPDGTGGYYQPVRLAIGTPNGDAFTLERTRITCAVVGPSPDQLGDLNRRNHPNANPSVDSLAAAGQVMPSDDDASGARTNVSTGARVPLRASWAVCAEGAASCTGAESYAMWDLTTQSVAGRREAMRVSWFATAGSFDAEHTGRIGADETTSSDNTWVAPGAAGPVHLWVVLRDERGGVGFRGYVVQVK